MIRQSPTQWPGREIEVGLGSQSQTKHISQALWNQFRDLRVKSWIVTLVLEYVWRPWTSLTPFRKELRVSVAPALVPDVPSAIPCICVSMFKSWANSRAASVGSVE